MHSKYVLKADLTVVKETYSDNIAKYPFDTTVVYDPQGDYSASQIRSMLEAAYNAGRRHALMGVENAVHDLKRIKC